MFKVYRVLENVQLTEKNFIFKNIQPMIKEECIVRIYIVRGVDLQGQDSNGKVKSIFIKFETIRNCVILI
jgi:hypothetical protein